MWFRKRLTIMLVWLVALCMPTVVGAAQETDDAGRVIREHSESYEALYQRSPDAVDQLAGMSLHGKFKGQEVSAAGVRTAKSLIPGYLVDQYMSDPYLRDSVPAQAHYLRDSASPHTESASYIVQRGDTLYRIAKTFGVSVDMLMVQNRITDPTKLQIGQRLTIPAATHDQEISTWLAGKSEISDVFYATLTAYTAGYESTGKTPSHPAYGITASGAKVKENHTIAVDPDVIPLGTLVYIEGLGIRKAEDTGSAIKGHKIDVYIPDLEEALEFGVKKNVRVYVLDKDAANLS